MPVTTLKSSLIEEANKCVLCGMCLPHCPTYSLDQNENESPRGRLMLGKALLLGDLEETLGLVEHIDHCLVCRSCEKCCPSGVQFGAFMDGLRNHLSSPTTAKHDFSEVLVSQEKRRSLNKKLWLGQRSGILGIGKTILGKSDSRLIKSLPKINRFHELDTHYPANGTELASVMLFAGCHSELLGNVLLHTAIKLLTQLGISVIVPAQQECCGGLSRHSGDAETANQLEIKNLAAFDDDSDTPILTLASGCGASLMDYDSLANSSPANKRFAARITDINQFILSHLENNKDILKPLRKKLLLHTPCSMKNVMRQDIAVFKLLKLIPDLEISHISSQRGCCGAAGTYMYEHADNADALREPIIIDVKNQQADFLVTTNIGCAMHIQAGLKESGQAVEILHPVEILSRAIHAKDIGNT